MRVLGFCFYALSVILAIIGFYIMYTYGSFDPNYPSIGDSTGHVVGGDAYNYIIIGVRGLGWIAAGILLAVIGAGCSIYAVVQEHYKLNFDIEYERKKLEDETEKIQIVDTTNQIEVTT